MSQQPLDADTARQIVYEAERRRELADPAYVKECFERQRQFIFSKARFKAWQAGRRGGKTEMLKRGLLMRAGLYPETIHAYIGLTQAAAKRLLWRPMKRLAKKHNLPIRFHSVELIAFHENGSEIWVLGADKEDDMEKLRGPAYKTVAIDEAASYRAHLMKLVEDVLEPALGDHLGELWLTGSPGRACAGLFWGATQHLDGFKDYRLWKSNVLQNPKFPQDPVAWLADIRRRRGWSEDHPTYRREYLGQWVKNDSALVYKFSEDDIFGRDGELATKGMVVSRLPELPEGEHYRYILGIDFGVVDPCAFVIWAYQPYDPNIYCVEAYQRTDMSPSDAAEHIKMLRLRYQHEAGAASAEDTFEAEVGDTGGQGKAFTKEFEQRHGIMVRAAEKVEKVTYIDHFNGDMLASRVKFLEGKCEPYLAEMKQLVWREVKGGNERLMAKYDEKLQDDHCCDAGLYSWRWSYHHRAEEREETPVEGTPEHDEMIERELLYEDLAVHGDGTEDIGIEREAWWETIV